MTPDILFILIISIIIIDFLIDKTLSFLNAKHYNDAIPNELKDVYNESDYKKSQDYKKVNYRFSTFTSIVSTVVTLLFFFFDGFKVVDELARSFSDNNILITLIFFGLIVFASDLLTTPFSYYRIFVIEEKFGFNKTTKKLFLFDKLKGWLLMLIIGGGILALVTLFYEKTGKMFWIYTWGLITLFSIFMNMFYSTLIVPLFNKQTPLEKGELKSKIEDFAKKVGFKLDEIFIIDGSKRSTKANAYFSGLGPKKRIVLYDTLVNDLDTDEIVAVLAHEVGHFKKKHILFNLVSSIALTGFTLFLLSLIIENPLLSEALNVAQPSFHIGLIVFGVLYSPISEITGLIMNYLSRVFEYQADNFAKNNFEAKYLISSLKKLSKNNLSNLTPHKAYVFMHYSHPTLLQRILNLKK